MLMKLYILLIVLMSFIHNIIYDYAAVFTIPIVATSAFLSSYYLLP